MPYYDLIVDDKKDPITGYCFTSHKSRKRFLSLKDNKHLRLSKIVYSKKEANEYFKKNNVVKIINEADIFSDGPIKKCVLCDRNVDGRQICGKCYRLLREINELLISSQGENVKLHKRTRRRPLTIQNVAIIRNKYCPKEKDVFEYIKENLQICENVLQMTKEERKVAKSEFWSNRFVNNVIDINNIPQYIINFFRDNDSFKFLDIRGSETQVEVFVECLFCGKRFWTPFRQIENGRLNHQCTNNTSKGEHLMVAYLESKGVKVLTQYDTLRCINPKTGYILPYDGQVNAIKRNCKYKGIIVEVQGAQHEHYVELFHSSKEAFEYQKYKDNIKREFAISNNYLFVEIFYNQINNGEYKTILQKALDEII